MDWLEARGYRLIEYPFGVRGPDFFLVDTSAFVYLDGCFWHGCPKCYREPKTNVSFWRPKIAANRARDRLRERVAVRIWEHEVGPQGSLSVSAARRIGLVAGTGRGSSTCT